MLSSGLACCRLTSIQCLAFDACRRIMGVVLCVMLVLPYLTDLYEIKNEMTSDNLEFDFKFVEGLTN